MKWHHVLRTAKEDIYIYVSRTHHILHRKNKLSQRVKEWKIVILVYLKLKSQKDVQSYLNNKNETAIYRKIPRSVSCPLTHLSVHNPPVLQPNPTAHIPLKVFISRIRNYWKLISFLCLFYLSLLILPYRVCSYYPDYTVLLTASNWTPLWQVQYFYPPTKFGLSLPLSEIYFDIQILSKILSSIHCFKFTSQYVLNGRVQRSFTENRAEIPDIL